MSTTTGAAERRLRPARILGASAAAALIALSLVAGAALDRAHERTRTVEVTAAAATVERALGTATTELVSDAAGHALAASERGAAARVPRGYLGTAVVTELGDRRRTSAGDLAPVGDPLAVPEILAALDMARDSATTVVSAPITVGQNALPVVVVPVYRSADGTRVLQAGRTIPLRRTAIDSWWLGSVDVDALAGAGLSAVPGNDLALRLTDGTATFADRGDPAFAVREVPIPAPPRTWTLAVGAASTPDTPGTVWAVVAFGVLSAAGVGALAWWSDRRRRQLGTARDELEAQLALVTEIAPVVQQSLELADVLPTVALHLMDELALSGVACALVGDQGRPVDLFAIGTQVDRETPIRLSVPDQIGADQTLALSLQRGGRSVGVLRIRAERALGGSELRSLSAVADLATAAIINARLFEQQQEAVARLQQVDELKTVFLGTASHELRTPVTAIVGFARLLNEGWDGFTDDQRREYTERIARNAHALDRLVQDLLDFARLERGGLRTGSEEVDLSRVIPQAVRGIEPAHPDHRLEFSVDDAAVILGDRSGIERIVNNLISNATKYSPPRSTVRITVHTSDHGVALVVDDEGPGVDVSDRERVFSRFFRGAGEEVVRTRGVGIGLSVVKEFADQMGATISVADAPSGGARFVLHFPPVDAARGRSGGTRNANPVPPVREGPIEEGSTHVPRT